MGSSNRNRLPLKHTDNCGVTWQATLGCGDKNRRARSKPPDKQTPIYAEEFAKAQVQRLLTPVKAPPIGGCQALKTDNARCNRKPIVRYRRLYPASVTPNEEYPAGEAVTQFCARHADAKDGAMRINWEREIIPTH
jgi:hypothetical protein